MIQAITEKNRVICDTQQDINKCFGEFYKLLYEGTSETRESEIEEALELVDLPKLDAEEAERLEDPITKKELKHTIRGLLSRKASRVDGLYSEFYKEFMAEITPPLLAILNESLDKGILPLSLRE